MRFIWATRGKHWGFRFLRDGGFADPLIPYDEAFDSAPRTAEVWVRGAEWVALRFPDLAGRTDAAGRVISHEFVVFAPEGVGFSSFTDARDRVWAEVASEYAQLWDAPR